MPVATQAALRCVDLAVAESLDYRILLSNTRMVAAAVPGADSGKYRLQYKLKFYEAGKEISRKYVNIKDVDEVFPARK